MRPEDLSALEELRGSDDCPSDLALDRLVAGELAADAAEKIRAHAASCSRCGPRLTAFESAPAPPPARGPARVIDFAAARRRRLGIAGAIVAVAASLLLVFVPRGPGDGTRSKGGISLELVVRHPDGRVEDVLPGAELSPDDAIRFRLSLDARSYVAVLGLDARGQVTAYWPDGAAAQAIEAGTDRLLEGSIILDDTLGTERVFAIACDSAMPVRRLLRLGRHALDRAGHDPARVTRLASGCAETSFTMHKIPRP